MNRQALLVESSVIPGQPDLQGARADVRNLSSFLQSNMGGAWELSEITILHNPSRDILMQNIQRLSGKEYLFFSFSGHGCHPASGYSDDTMICLNQDEDVPVRQLYPNVQRCAMLIDACRQIVAPALIREVSRRHFTDESKTLRRKLHRAAFDEAVLQAESGVIRLYSCKVSESADEDASGGFYTTNLIECACDWYESATYLHPCFSLWDVHQCAARMTISQAPSQHPEYLCGRRNVHFPFAVRP